MQTPQLFQSKILCFSLFYLFFSLFFLLYSSIYSTECIFKSSPFDPIQSNLFNYPQNYGQHKYALPSFHSSCNSPVFFKDYWVVLKEIKEILSNSSLGLVDLKYLKGDFEGFGGNFSVHKRLLYFDYGGNGGEIPCGFFKGFPVLHSDRISMESCKGVVVVSAIFNDHDKIRQPLGLGSKTLDNVCFFMFVDDITLSGLEKHNLISRKWDELKIGVWRIVRVETEHLYENAAMNGVIPKYLVHRLFPHSKFSIWIDAKIQLVVDPLLLIHSLVIVENVDMAISKHPHFVHTLEEAMATARWKKWSNVESLKTQMEIYCENGLEPWTPNKLPYSSDVPDSALIIRKHGAASNLFSCLLFNELDAFNPRDQLAFAFVRDKMKMNPNLKMNMFDVEVFEHIATEFRHNIKHHDDVGSVTSSKPEVKTKRVTSDLFGKSKCDFYLSKMWGETHD